MQASFHDDDRPIRAILASHVRAPQVQAWKNIRNRNRAGWPSIRYTLFGAKLLVPLKHLQRRVKIPLPCTKKAPECLLVTHEGGKIRARSGS
jgi:hypothetical protein